MGGIPALISARTDAEAVAAWLKARGARAVNTHTSYKREATRLLVWLEEERKQAHELSIEDVHKYFDFLRDPPAHWLRPRKPRRDEVLAPTQLLIGGLKPDGIAYARTVMGNLFAWLQAAGYLQWNPFKLSASPSTITRTSQQRFLDLSTWQWLLGWLEQQPARDRRAEARNERDIWVMQLLYHTGIRREECAFGVMGDFRKREDEWALRVIGKGEKERFVTVNSSLLDALIRHRRNRGLPPMPSPGDSDPIVRAVARGNDIPLTPRQIGKILERIAKQASLDCEDGHMRQQLVAMSTHWLRHTNATHRLMAGASLETTQDELGHGDPRTTRIYAQTLDAARREDAEKLSKLR